VRFKSILLIISIFFLHACKKEKSVLFKQLKPSKTGINFINKLNNTPNLNILNYLYYYNGAGVLSGDFNNDGFPDLYFTANQDEDKFYLNNGDLTFEDITSQSGISNKGGWTTGVTNVDINNDGLLDIYICKVGDFNVIKGRNLLYVNKGLNTDGIPQFEEMASDYNLDIQSLSTQASFFDYDLDGDLDMFLLNHSVHPNSNYGKGNKRKEIDSLSGDKLFRNENGSFVEVSKNAGIFQGKIGYGLGISTSDLNNDGYPDIYISNDFFENNYLYINQKDGTFKDIISGDVTKMGHTSHFSMGSDIADINNDGYADIVSLDMLPENLETYKTSSLEFAYQNYDFYLKNGYAPQYMQNTLHLNLGNTNYSETSFLSGIAATEWSWSALFADLDNDGYKDLHISNGIKGATNDMDFINFIANDNIQRRLSQGMSKEDMAFIDEIPVKKVSNYFYKNNGNVTFSDMTQSWFKKIPSFSNGTIYTDLDKDGDLDLVINNIDEPAFILENLSEKKKEKNNFIALDFDGNDTNRFGIGVKVIAYLEDGKKIIQENYTTKGYLSAVNPGIHLGLGKIKEIDSLRILWPDRTSELLVGIKTNQFLKINKQNATIGYTEHNNTYIDQYLENIDTNINFIHKENATVEFNRDPLIPFVNTNQGPKISSADINNDGLTDFFIGGAKAQTSHLFIQNTDGTFKLSEENSVFEEDAINEDTDHHFFDIDNDGDQDLIVVSGGNEFKSGKQLSPRLYFNNKGVFTKDTLQFNNVALNASTVKSIDLDNDGDLDLSITSNGVPWKFGVTPQQYLFENNGKGIFKDISLSYAKEFQNIGLVQDILWVDINNDSYKDAIVVGHWMPISIFLNDGKTLKLQQNNSLKNTNGWWNSIQVSDFDNDGDLDFMAGNWGLNSRLSASKKEPITLYSNDFDDNGSIEPIVTYFYQGIETPFASKDELVKQMPFLNKKFLSYQDFAKSPFKKLFPSNKIKTAYKKQLFELSSIYIENLGNATYAIRKLPFAAQVSAIFDIAVDDFNKDGYKDVLIAGNNYEISTQLGRLDASHGLLLLNDKKGFFKEASGQQFNISGPARAIHKIKIKGEEHFLITINNNQPILLKKKNE